MLWWEACFLFLICGLVAAGDSLDPPPSFAIRACGEDGLPVRSICVTKHSQANVLDWHSATKFCKLRGGELLKSETISEIISKRNMQLPGIIWSSRRCSAWKIRRRRQKESVTRDCNSKLPVMCEWKQWTAPGKCPHRYRQAGQKCYRVFDDLIDSIAAWKPETEARRIVEEKCKEDGASLTSMTTAMDKSTILSAIQGYSRVNVIVAEIDKTSIIFGDSAVRPGILISYKKFHAPLGFVCEKKMKKTIESRKSLNQPCGDGFETFHKESSLCFKRGTKSNWKKAKEYCKSLQSSLVSIDSYYDNAIVHLVRLLSEDDIWIDFNADYNTQMLFNNSLNRHDDSNPCGTMTNQGRWKFISCESDRRFYCFKRRSRKLLPKQCDNGDGLSFNGICYSKTQCENKEEWKFATLKSKAQVAFLLNWRMSNKDQCLKVSNQTHFEYVGTKATSSDSRTILIDYFGETTTDCSDTIPICEKKGQEPKPTLLLTSPSPKAQDRGAILIISILSSLLGATIIIFGVSVTVYCLVCRPQEAAPQALEAELKQKTQLQPIPLARTATVSSVPPRNNPFPSSLPIVPPQTSPLETEGDMEEIYEPMDDIC